MVIRTRISAILLPLAFYAFSGVVGSFFVWHASHGERGIAADLETRRQMAEVESELKTVRAERRNGRSASTFCAAPRSTATCSTRKPAISSIASTRMISWSFCRRQTGVLDALTGPR